MDTNIDIKHEEVPQTYIEIKGEPHDMQSKIKIEAEECEDTDVKHEQDLTQEERLKNLLLDYEDQSQKRQMTDVKFVAVASGPSELNAVYLNEKEYDNQTEENRVNYTAQSVRNMFSQTGDKRFKCNICCKYYATKQSVTSHLRRRHTIGKRFKCSICDKQFPEKSFLLGHLYVHTNEKPFKCNVCIKSFSQKSTLIRHIRTHTKEKPFKCDVCNKSFADKSDLSKHARIHNIEKPFKCNICSKPFSDKSNLTRHLQNHRTEPFKCNLCNESYFQKIHLATHLRSHSNETSKCGI